MYQSVPCKNKTGNVAPEDVAITNLNNGNKFFIV